MWETNAISEEAIARRAHEIWEREGRPDGRSQDHWEQARIELAEAASIDPDRSVEGAEAVLSDEAIGAAEIAEAVDAPAPEAAPEAADPPAKPKRRPRAKAPAAEPAPHETLDGTPDSFLDNLSPTPKGRSRKKAAP
jgi:hypothetical protein